MTNLNTVDRTLKYIRIAWVVTCILLLPYMLSHTTVSVLSVLEFLYFYLMTVVFFYAVVYSEIAIEEYVALDKSKMSQGDIEYARSELILVLSVFSIGAGCVFLFAVVKLVSLVY